LGFYSPARERRIGVPNIFGILDFLPIYNTISAKAGLEESI
jgi:hypothetical protein